MKKAMLILILAVPFLLAGCDEDVYFTGFNKSEITNANNMNSAKWAAGQRHISVGDFNGDGKADLLLQGANVLEETLLLLADGSGGFSYDDITTEFGMSKPLWAAGQRNIFVGDFNGDGNSDLLLQGRNITEQSFLLLADGSGGFTNYDITNKYGMSKPLWASGQRKLHIGDFNGDGNTDVLLQGSSTAEQTLILIADSAGGFRNAEDITIRYGMNNIKWASGQRKLHVGDFNGDNNADVLLQGSGVLEETLLLLADGSGGFHADIDITNEYLMDKDSWASGKRIIHVGDFNGDGCADLLLQSSNWLDIYSLQETSSKETLLLMADGPGGFADAVDITNKYGMNKQKWCALYTKVFLADFDGNGRTDILLQGNSGSNCTGLYYFSTVMLLAKETGEFYTVNNITDSFSMDKIQWTFNKREMHVADYNGDGISDILLQGQNTLNAKETYLLSAETSENFSDSIFYSDGEDLGLLDNFNPLITAQSNSDKLYFVQISYYNRNWVGNPYGDTNVRIRLIPPEGSDYDLFLYRESFDSEPYVSETRGTDTEELTLNWSDVTTPVLSHIMIKCHSGCNNPDDWTLEIESNPQ